MKVESTAGAMPRVRQSDGGLGERCIDAAYVIAVAVRRAEGASVSADRWNSEIMPRVRAVGYQEENRGLSVRQLARKAYPELFGGGRGRPTGDPQGRAAAFQRKYGMPKAVGGTRFASKTQARALRQRRAAPKGNPPTVSYGRYRFHDCSAIVFNNAMTTNGPIMFVAFRNRKDGTHMLFRVDGNNTLNLAHQEVVKKGQYIIRTNPMLCGRHDGRVVFRAWKSVEDAAKSPQFRQLLQSPGWDARSLTSGDPPAQRVDAIVSRSIRR